MDFQWVGITKFVLFSILVFFYFGMMYVINKFIKIISDQNSGTNKVSVARNMMLMHYSIIWMLYKQAGSLGFYTYSGLNESYVDIVVGLIFIFLAVLALKRLLRIANGLPADEARREWYEKDPNKLEWFEKKNEKTDKWR